MVIVHCLNPFELDIQFIAGIVSDVRASLSMGHVAYGSGRTNMSGRPLDGGTWVWDMDTTVRRLHILYSISYAHRGTLPQLQAKVYPLILGPNNPPLTRKLVRQLLEDIEDYLTDPATEQAWRNTL